MSYKKVWAKHHKTMISTFQGTIARVTQHQKVTKVILDDGKELLAFKNEDSSNVFQSSSTSDGPLKDKMIPVYIPGAHLKATCTPFSGTWAIKEISVNPPRDHATVKKWLLQGIKPWMLALKDYRKPKNPDAPSLSKIQTLFIMNGKAFEELFTDIVKTYDENESPKGILDHAIQTSITFKNTKVGDACSYIFGRIIAYYKKASRFHLIKDDVLLLGYGNLITDAEILKAIEFCDNYSQFREDPYACYKSKRTTRMSFAILDLFAAMYGASMEKRIRANVWHHMQTMMANEGHTYANTDVVYKAVWKGIASRTRKDCPDEETGLEMVRDVVECDASKEFVIVPASASVAPASASKLFLGYVYGMEKYVTQRIQGLLQGLSLAFGKPYDEERRDQDEELENEEPRDIDPLIREFESQQGIQFHELQIKAIREFFNGKRFHVLTGLPGTGKSSVVKCIWHIAEARGLKCLTCAPTGKAANRLGDNASTIHRALHVKMDDAGKFAFTFNEREPLKVDIIIVDEVSMLDLELCYRLFKAIPRSKCRVIFIGDENQLPSVNYGDVLRRLLTSDRIPHTHLTKIYRQGKGSTISRLAECIVDGKVPPQSLLNEGSPELEWIPLKDTMSIHKRILELYVKLSKQSSSVAILIPTKKGDEGTFAVNSTLHRYLFKEDADEKTLKFKPGEKIMVVTNSYARDEEGEIINEKSVFNGESGHFKDYKSGGNATITVGNKEVTIDKQNIDMGYAFTTHKSQGSEYNYVILVLHDSHGIMLNREVLYTSVTRAKKRLFIIGTDDCIRKCIARRCPGRNSMLMDEHFVDAAV
jgi:RecD/TraA family predicted helicase